MLTRISASHKAVSLYILYYTITSDLSMPKNERNTVSYTMLGIIALIILLTISPTIVVVRAQVSGVQSSKGDQQATNSSSSSVATLRGAIASTQDNKEGKPNWIAQGNWNMTLAKPLNQGQPHPIASAFLSTINVAALNGSSKPKYSIYDFKQTQSSMNTTADSPIIINGIATIASKKGILQNVPIGITLWHNNVLHLWMDPAKTGNQFGQMPIYGTITKKTLGWLGG